MEAAFEHLVPETTLSLPEAMEGFFARFDAEGAYGMVLALFRGWVCQGEGLKGYGEEDMALFCDQLIGLVAAASQLHQTNRVFLDQEGGTGD